MKKYLLAGVLSAFSISAMADSTCQGKITYVGISRGANVLVSGPGGLPSTYLCDLQEKQNNVEPEACKAIYSALLSAKAQDKSVRITFNPNISSCSEVASWGWAKDFNWVLID